VTPVEPRRPWSVRLDTAATIAASATVRPALRAARSPRWANPRSVTEEARGDRWLRSARLPGSLANRYRFGGTARRRCRSRGFGLGASSLRNASLAAPALESDRSSTPGFGRVECETPRKARLPLDLTLGCGQVAEPRLAFGSVVSGTPPSGGDSAGVARTDKVQTAYIAPRMTPATPRRRIRWLTAAAILCSGAKASEVVRDRLLLADREQTGARKTSRLVPGYSRNNSGEGGPNQYGPTNFGLSPRRRLTT
jgi:hypothetical protein